MNHVHASFMWQSIVKNAAGVCAQQTNQKLAKIFDKNRRAKKIVLLISSLTFFQSNQIFQTIQKEYSSTICRHFYLQKVRLQNQRRKKTKDTTHQVHLPTEGPECYLDGRRPSWDSYSSKVLHKISYTTP